MKSIVNCIAIVISFFAICVESQGADVKSSRVPKNSIEEVDGIVTISVFIDKRVEPKVKELEGTAMLRTNRLLRRQFKALPRNFSLPVSVERADYDANEEIYTYVTKIRRSDIEEWILNYKEEEKQRIAAEKAAAEKAAAEKAAAEKAAAEKAAAEKAAAEKAAAEKAAAEKAAAEKAAAEKAAAEKAAAEKAAAEKAAAEKAAAEKAAAEKAAAEKAAAEKAAAEKAAAEKAAAEKAAAEKAAAEKAAAEKAAAEKAAAEKAAAEKAAAEKAAAEKAEAEKLAVARAAAQKVVEARRNLEAKERSQNDEKGHVRIVQPASPREDDLGVKGGNDSLIEESKSKSLGELKPETAEEAEQRNANENKMADDAIMNLFK